MTTCRSPFTSSQKDQARELINYIDSEIDLINDLSVAKINSPIVPHVNYISVDLVPLDSIKNTKIETPKRKNKFSIDDKVKIIKSCVYLTCAEKTDLKDMEGFVTEFRSSAYHDCVSYKIDINGKVFNDLSEDILQLLESKEQRDKSTHLIDKYSQEYEDLDGVILKDSNPSPSLIQNYKDKI